MKLRLSTIALCSSALVANIPSVLGWGAAGHEIIATIAQIHLHPTVLPVLCDILNYTNPNPNAPQCHLAPPSTWADKLKYRMRWSAALHYVGARDDHPSETCAFPGDHGWAGSKNINVLAGVRNVTGLLDSWVEGTGSDGTAEEALKFLIHFVGDLHMPLHLTGRDRGGNSVKVTFDGRQSNLHSVWDGLLIAKTLRNVPRKYDHPLPIPSIERNLRGAIYDGWIRQIVWEGILHDWKDDVQVWLTCPSEDSASSANFAVNYLHPAVLKLWNYLSSVLTPLLFSTSSTTDDATICPQFWAHPIHTMNCDFVWPKALDEPPYSLLRFVDPDTSSSSSSDHIRASSAEEQFAILDKVARPRPKSPYLELDTPEYAGYIAKNRILEKLMAQGGIRLAGILNWLFADLGDGAGARASADSVSDETRKRVRELFVSVPEA